MSKRLPDWLRAIGREPLVHFLVAGALLFVVFRALHPGAPVDDGQRIRIDKPTLLTFLQYRAKAFEPALFEAQFDAMAPAERQSLIDDFVREEVMYREAESLQLAQGDYVIRQRLIQKLEYLLDDLAVPTLAPSQADLDTYLHRHEEDYREPPNFTFTHVFFDAAVRGDSAARDLAAQTLAALRKNQVTFAAATPYGDRFPFLRNYVERTWDYVASQFGEPMTELLSQIHPSNTDWQGPYQSPYGWHLVMLTRYAPARLPAIAEIESIVREDYLREARDAARDTAIRQRVDQYDVDIAADVLPD